MISEKQLDAGAKALREFEMAGRITINWEALPKAKKRKWWGKAFIVLGAAGMVSPEASQQPTE